VTDADPVASVIAYWFGKAREALASARSELAAGRVSFAVNRMYYACFYAASAHFLERGVRFTKHAGVRAAVHRELVKTGILAVEEGRLYDRLFVERQEADYLELTDFEPSAVQRDLEDAEGLVNRLRGLSTRLGSPS
jgi:uncharacterized protein (UPF0332 family)